MSSLVDWLNGSLKEIRSEAFKDVVRVEEAVAEPLGDGQVVVISDIKRATLDLVTNNGQVKKLKAIQKLEPQNKIGEGMAQMLGVFQTEIKMYTDVLKSMEELMTEAGDKEYPWAECYCAGDNKLLFQDLCEDDYRVVPTYKFLDFEHCLLVMEAIGKFHALSLALKERCKLDTDHFKCPYYAMRVPFMDQMFSVTIAKVVESIKETWGPEWKPVADRLSKYMENPGEMIQKAWESSRGKWAVLNHGDFSMRNMLFHYNSATDKPDGIKLVDFQICHYSSLGNDLVTLLYSSVLPQVREDNMASLLKTYVTSLTSNSRRFGYTGPLPTVQEVEDCIRCLDPLMVATMALNLPSFVYSGKVNMQEKADEYFEKYGSCEEAMKNIEKDTQESYQIDFNDKDIKDILLYEMKRCTKLNIF